MPFTIATHDHSSTLVLSESKARALGAPQVPMQVITLNELFSLSGAPFPDMVKIDAEGFDLKVLAGASKLLGKTDIFLVEAMVCGPYENSASLVMQFMAGAGYRLLDITSLERSPKHGVLWLCELAFLRNGSPLLDKVDCFE